MKYRLGKNLGKNGFRGYLSDHLFILSRIAEDIGISNNALYSYLDGDIRKPRREILEKMADITGLQFGIDEEGVYFDDDPGEVIVAKEPEADEELQEVLAQIKKIKDPKRRALTLEIITILNEMSPEKQKIIKALLGIID
ncbi:MAG: hypothetical protein KDE62_08615 [Calditrichaeota bacterium]|nr:hypothetical protein [Calditrichota bacterium]